MKLQVDILKPQIENTRAQDLVVAPLQQSMVLLLMMGTRMGINCVCVGMDSPGAIPAEVCNEGGSAV